MKFDDRLFQHTYANGLTLVADHMPWLHSAAFSIAIPAGCKLDPADRFGLCNLSCELAFRETESLSSRELVETLDLLGCDYYSSTSVMCTYFGGSLPAIHLAQALAVYADVVRNPKLSPAWLEEARLSCLQEVESLEDDLPSRVMSRLRMMEYGDPWGRVTEGTTESLQQITLDEIRKFVFDQYAPQGTIIAVAGQFDFESLRDLIGSLFGDWKNPATTAGGPTSLATAELEPHMEFPSKQTHIGLAWPGEPYDSDDWFRSRCAVGVLSDGMSSRLFREVRERRGLCYSVMASCHAIPGRGSCFGYCGTTTDAAQQALDVMIAEITRLKEGITPQELARLKVQVRSGLIMQQESCRSRVGTMISDWLLLGRLRPVDEPGRRIAALTVEQINSYVSDHPAGPFNLVTLGETPLGLTGAIPTTQA